MNSKEASGAGAEEKSGRGSRRGNWGEEEAEHVGPGAPLKELWPLL